MTTSSNPSEPHTTRAVIAPMAPEHGPQVLAIYQAGIDTGNATFATAAPTWPDFDRDHLPDHRFVALDPNGNVTGWIAASPASSLCVYTGVIEHSVYVDPNHSGKGVGTALLQALIDSTETAGVWTIETGILPENHASLALHHAHGFRTVGTRERIGQHNGHWRDVVLIERRSNA